MQNVLEEACAFYQAELTQNSEARKYLTETRKISPEMIQQFRIGFAPNSWEFLANKFPLDSLVKCDLAIIPAPNPSDEFARTEPYDKMRNLITFPIFDIDGKIARFQGRITKEDDQFGKWYNYYPHDFRNRQDPIFYGLNFAKEAVKEKGRLFLFEGNIDTVLAHQNKLTNSAALLGQEFDEEKYSYLRNLFGKIRFTLCFDYDIYGIKAAATHQERYKRNDLVEVCVVKGKKRDPADVFSEGSDITKNLQNLNYL